MTKKRQSPSTSRRSILKKIGVLGAVGVSGTSIAAASEGQQATRGKFVSVSHAREAAEQMVPHLAKTDPEVNSWQRGSVGRPTKYYTLTTDGSYDPAAYVFPIASKDTSDKVLGYITIAARRTWSPVLEYSTGVPPSARQDAVEQSARAMGDTPDGRLLYQGGVNYGIQLDGQEMIHLGTHQKMIARPDSDILAFDEGDQTVNTQAQWETAVDPSTSGMGTMASGSNQVGITDYVWDAHVGNGVSGSDTGTGTGNRNDCYGCRGLADDPWKDWDGCIPIAGTQIVMYHEEIENTWSNRKKREKICDELHMEMKTGDDHSTSFGNIPGGFTGLSLSFVNNDYGANQELLITKNLFTSDIDSNQPLMINRPYDICNWGICIESATTDDVTTSSKDKNNYDGHTVIAAGYQNGGDQLEVFTSWDTNRHTISYDSWGSRTQVTRVWTN